MKKRKFYVCLCHPSLFSNFGPFGGVEYSSVVIEFGEGELITEMTVKDKVIEHIGKEFVARNYKIIAWSEIEY